MTTKRGNNRPSINARTRIHHSLGTSRPFFPVRDELADRLCTPITLSFSRAASVVATRAEPALPGGLIFPALPEVLVAPVASTVFLAVRLAPVGPAPTATLSIPGIAESIADTRPSWSPSGNGAVRLLPGLLETPGARGGGRGGGACSSSSFDTLPDGRKASRQRVTGNNGNFQEIWEFSAVLHSLTKESLHARENTRVEALQR